MKKCPKCGCEEFYVTAHVTQDWKVDKNGRFIECSAQCVQVVRGPDNYDLWYCANCDYEAEGNEFEVREGEDE